MKKLLAIFSALGLFLTMFTTTAMAAGSSTGGENATTSPFDGPLVLLSLLTLAFMYFLIVTDNN